MFPKRISLDDVADFNFFRTREIGELSLSEKIEYIIALKAGITELKEEIEYVESTVE